MLETVGPKLISYKILNFMHKIDGKQYDLQDFSNHSDLYFQVEDPVEPSMSFLIFRQTVSEQRVK